MAGAERADGESAPPAARLSVRRTPMHSRAQETLTQRGLVSETGVERDLWALGDGVP